jgi:predicted Zn-dependent peptidase
MTTTVARKSGGSVYQKTILKNGMRVVTERLPSVRSVSLGVWIDLGSRNERPEENGFSHLIEHLLFKGTGRRTAKQVADSLESLGGSLNGFTSREQTCFYARVLDEYLIEAVDVLADMTCFSTLSATNVNREKTVVCEEIKESLDTPTDRIHDIFSTAYWGDHPLGQPIMGPQENILGATRSKLRSFMGRHYRAGSVVLSASGSVSHSKLVNLARTMFELPSGMAEPALPAVRKKPHEIVVTQVDNNQTHLCLGFPGVSYAAPDKFTALALSSYLGGGMSSVLFQKVREQKGLAYSVYTYVDAYRDDGLFGAYVGTDAKQVTQAYDLILKEFRRLKKRALSVSQVEKIKAQLKGSLILAYESTTNRMNRLARQEMMSEGYHTLRQTILRIERVSPSDILELANRLFDENKLAIAVLGPVDNGLFADGNRNN